MRKPALLLVAAAMMISAAFLTSSASATPEAAPPAVQAKVKKEIFRVFGTGSDGWCMLRVAWRESGFDPKAINWNDVHSDGSRGSFGVFQIGAVNRHYVGGNVYRLLDYRTNIRVAKRMYDSLGIRPWRSC